MALGRRMKLEQKPSGLGLDSSAGSCSSVVLAQVSPGHLLVTLGHLLVNQGHVLVTLGHLLVTLSHPHRATLPPLPHGKSVALAGCCDQGPSVALDHPNPPGHHSPMEQL